MTNLQKLQLINEKIHECQKCEAFIESTVNHAPGDGNPDAKIVLIGEALGKTETEQGKVFVGKSGELLTNILTACGIKREDVYITNICRCRPPSNRKPLPEEAENCRPFLDLQLKAINPKYIVCLGASAAQYLLNTDTLISRLRGQWFEYGGAKVLCTFHPSFALRYSTAKHEIYQDIMLVVKELQQA